MARNHLPGDKDLETFGRPLYAESPFRGVGFGLGFAVLLDPVPGKVIGTAGELSWGGAASTAFWIDPAEDLTVSFFTQLLPSSTYPIRPQLRQLVYQALTATEPCRSPGARRNQPGLVGQHDRLDPVAPGHGQLDVQPWPRRAGRPAPVPPPPCGPSRSRRAFTSSPSAPHRPSSPAANDRLMVDELAYHIFIQATAQDVWDALTEPGWTRKYGYRTLVKYDTRPDGVYLAYASGRRYGQRAGDLVISGEVLEAEPPKRLVQTWHPMFDATAAAEPPTRLTWEIQEQTGLTAVSVGTNVPEPRRRPRSPFRRGEGSGGWSWVLSDLKTLLETAGR